MQQNIIWTNDTDQIDAIIDDWKQEAAHLATAMAENPKETMADATYGVDVILEKAWKYVVGECEYFCDAGWGDEANAICHLEDAIDD